jgi:hypothetical protein
MPACGFGAGTCTDTLDNPNRCGNCFTQCGDTQYCNGSGSCACRPGLTQCTVAGSLRCVDTSSNPFACGGCGKQCASGEECKAGACVSSTTSCGGGGMNRCNVSAGGTTRASCVNTNTDPLNCGGCNNLCNRDELCVGGNCRLYAAAIPGASCNTLLGGGGVLCSAYGSMKSQICVEGSVCP